MLVSKWADEKNIEINIEMFDSAEKFLSAYDDYNEINIILLDIQMNGMDGVTLAKKIRAVNKELQIIFITGYMDYIAAGYDVEALHYLLKPVTAEKLHSILDRAKDKLKHNERALFINHAGENARIPLYKIHYLEVWHNYVTIHADAEYKVKKTLSELEKELDDGFFRAGRSHIVNLKYIRKNTKKEIHMTSGAVIPLPRGLYEALNRAMIEKL
jgi:DNA-binding LytR/AlgR family response regulator